MTRWTPCAAARRANRPRASLGFFVHNIVKPSTRRGGETPHEALSRLPLRPPLRKTEAAA